ncbi:hemerythrin domain-containing protein [Roseateles saccharophilus]|nr:hemerythrin domain-containing protein [Roseateles saccharophilus]MDG0835317.1 hemerythrin domain-containing protein [Roseateles saccharophilus]
MSSKIALHAGPAVGFDQPFEMLAACHERVRRSLDLLQRLQAHVARHGVDGQARSAAADVLRYFDLAGPAHHEDEERHVLPRLRRAGLADLAERLQTQHDEMGRLWALLRQPLQAWAAGEPADLPDELLHSYIDLYAVHMPLEEGQAFPAAAANLEEPALESMGKEMAERRQGGQR